MFIRFITAALFAITALQSSDLDAQSRESFYAALSGQLRQYRDILPTGTSQPQIGDTDGDGRQEIYTITSEGKLYGTDSDGSLRPGFPVDLAQYTGWLFGTPAPALFDLDGDGKKEIIVTVLRFGIGPSSQGWLFVFTNNGQIFPGWPATGVRITNPSRSYDSLLPPSVAVIDGVAHPVAAIPREGIKVYTQTGELLHELNLQSEFVYRQTFGYTIADLNRDGTDEILVQTDLLLHVLNSADLTPFSNGFPIFTLVPPTHDIAVGNLDGTGDLEIVFTDEFSRGVTQTGLKVVDTSGNSLPGFPVMLPFSVYGRQRFILANVAGSAAPEIVVAGYQSPTTTQGSGWTELTNHIHVISSTGVPLTDFPIVGNQWRNLLTANDLDSDGIAEIQVSNTEGMTRYSSTGIVLTNIPYSIFRTPSLFVRPPFETAPVFTDLNGDGDTELIFSLLVDVTNNTGGECLPFAGPHQAACGLPVLASLDMGLPTSLSAVGAWPAPYGDERNSRTIR